MAGYRIGLGPVSREFADQEAADGGSGGTVGNGRGGSQLSGRLFCTEVADSPTPMTANSHSPCRQLARNSNSSNIR
jgi:hypothetical protein